MMAFKPAQTPKRPAPQDPSKSVEDVDEDPNDSYEARAKKRKIARKKAQAVRNKITFPIFRNMFSRLPTELRRKKEWQC